MQGPIWACAGAVAVAALFRRLVPADSDTPWHLAEGRLLLERWADGEWGIGRTDSFSWTARGSTWHPNSWAFDAVLAGIHAVGGWAGVAALRVGLLGAVAALAWVFSRRSGAGRWARAGAVWLAVVLVLPTGAMRSQLASFVLLLACLELAARILDADRPPPDPAEPGGRRRGRPWLLLLALAVTVSAWSSLHGGVIAGVAVLAAASAGDVLDRRAWRRSGPAAVVPLVALAASCLSPLGITVWTYALRTGGDSRRQGIEEWQPPSLQRADDVGIVLFLLVVTAWALWLRRAGSRTVSWRLVAPSLLATALTFLAVRNATFAVLASVPLLAALLGAAGGWLGRRGWAPPVRPGPGLAAMTIGALLAGAIQTGGLTFDPDPLGAAEYPSLAARALPSGCRLLNEYHFGGYLILTRPDLPVSQDGRNDLYGSTRLAEQEALFEDDDPVTAPAGLDRAGVGCVLAEPSRPLVRALAADRRWYRAAADSTAQAWVRTT